MICFEQHVLEHGKPHERSAIIQKLAGQIVQMSQQKFASNVVEKCLTFGGPEERQFLVNEMLGTTEENEPLQACYVDIQLKNNYFKLITAFFPQSLIVFFIFISSGH